MMDHAAENGAAIRRRKLVIFSGLLQQNQYFTLHEVVRRAD